VEKAAGAVDAEVELVDRTSMVYSGTAVARGRARAVVVSTGMATEIGAIAALLERTGQEVTPLQRQMEWLGKVLGLVVLALSAVVVGTIVVTTDASSASDVLDALLVGVSLAVAAVPEGLPAILTVVLALGVQRMAARHAIVKKLSSVETLGSASVICTDKTGTLTRNEMTIVRVATADGEVEITGVGYQPVGEVLVDGAPVHDEHLLRSVELVVGAGSLANDASMRLGDSGRWEIVGDPTEAAFLVAERKLELTERREARFERVGEIPFDSERKLMTTIDRDERAEADGPQLMVATKGAPDVLIERCTHRWVGGHAAVLTDEDRSRIADVVDRLADDALRTLAVAYRPLHVPADLVQERLDESVEQGLVHLGVVGIMDPPREEARAAIADARRAGIRVLMITGDHPRTAARIGERLGLATTGDSTERHVMGRDLAGLDEQGLVAALATTSVFSRVAPEHKLRIVAALQGRGEIVAMTGDGVNDAPALKQADIGVAMGRSGTEVSKEAADMILADDDFATILGAVREGREIFADIRKFLRYLLASNAGEVLVVFLGVVAAGALGLADATGGEGANALAVPLLATQILWINLLTDSALALALGVDPPVDDVLAAPPRRLTDRVIDRTMVVTIALVGTTAALAGLVALDLELEGGLLGGSGDIDTARTMVFTTIVLAQVFNAFNSRSDHASAFVRPFDNRLLWGAATITVALQVLVVHAGPLNRAFDTVPLDARRWLLCLGLASTVLVVEEVRKAVARARRAPA
jgi:calcium-translocating P-type ATPase